MPEVASMVAVPRVVAGVTAGAEQHISRANASFGTAYSSASVLCKVLKVSCSSP